MMRKLSRRGYLLRGGAAVTVATGLAGCLGESGDGDSNGDYPSDDIEVIIPFGQGGGTDTYTRAIVPQMEENLGVNMPMENVEGTAGLRGIQQTFQAEADGYTICSSPNPPAEIIAALLEEPDIDLRNMSFIGGVALAPWVIYANPDHNISDFDDLQTRYESNELELIGTQQPGGQDWIIAQIMKENSEFDLQWEDFVAYGGTGPISEAVISNEVPVGMGTDAAVADLADEVDIIAILTSEGSSIFSDAPTITELGYPNIDYIGQFVRGFGGPPDISEERMETLRESMKEAIESDELQEWSENTDNHLEWLGGADYLQGLVDEAYENIPETVDLEELRD